MNDNERNSDRDRRRDPRRRRRLPPNVVPLHDFIEVQRLMKKMDLRPADVLGMVHDFLSDLDRQIEEHEARESVQIPLWMIGETPPGTCP